jgi:hypothetical protein
MATPQQLLYISIVFIGLEMLTFTYPLHFAADLQYREDSDDNLTKLQL